MHRITILFLGFFILNSCTQHKTIPEPPAKNDSIIVSDDFDFIAPDIVKMRIDFISSYDNPVEFDTICLGKGDEIYRITGKYYCLFDSAITIPGKYNPEDTSKSFNTHNFAQDVLILKGEDTILKKTITKADFNDDLPQYLKDYAIIFEPVFDGYDIDEEVFRFHFSVSIPLTDVGESRILKIKRNGEILTGRN